MNRFNTFSKPIILLLVFCVLFLQHTSHAFALNHVPNLKFVPASKTANVGESFDISVVVDTVGQDAAGVGVDILFNPEYLNIVRVTPGQLFGDYPKATFDNTTGRVDISGISTSLDQTINGYGVFAGITFVAKKPGSSIVRIDFTPGETTESNIAVTYEPGDILAEVGELTVNTTGTGSVDTSEIPITSLESGVVSNSDTDIQGASFLDKILIFFGFKEDPTDSVDPNTITGLAPNTDPTKTQPVYEVGSNNSTLRLAMFAILVIILVLIALYSYKRLRNRKQTVYQNINDNPGSPTQPQ